MDRCYLITRMNKYYYKGLIHAHLEDYASYEIALQKAMSLNYDKAKLQLIKVNRLQS
jgi:hypothetical protein